MTDQSSKGWETIVNAKGDEFHVVPYQDEREHEISRDCLCHPRIKTQPVRVDDSIVKTVVIHASFDGREYFELDNPNFNPKSN